MFFERNRSWMYILYMQYALPSSWNICTKHLTWYILKKWNISSKATCHAEKKHWGRLNFFKGCITPVEILYFSARILLLKGIPRLQGNSRILKTLSLSLNNGRTRRCWTPLKDVVHLSTLIVFLGKYWFLFKGIFYFQRKL